MTRGVPNFTRNCLYCETEFKPSGGNVFYCCDECSFYSKVKINSDDACWEWESGVDKDGYGKFQFRENPWRAHRVSWTIYNGEIPEGMYVCHKCDNPTCVRPSHLWLGTDADNIHDMDEKGRRTPQSGEQNNASRLTKAQVIEIRELYANTDMFQWEIAEKFGVSRELVGQIVRRDIWSHLENKHKDHSDVVKLKRKGENHHLARLTEEQVIKIRELYASGDIFQRELAEQFGISRSQIGSIVNYDTWTHI